MTFRSEEQRSNYRFQPTALPERSEGKAVVEPGNYAKSWKRDANLFGIGAKWITIANEDFRNPNHAQR